MFVAKAVKKYADNFPEGTIFEFTEVTSGGVRRVDARVGDIFYEFKSVQSVPPSNFKTQFVKDMDLAEVTDLSQLKWWFDEDKVDNIPKELFLDELLDNPPSLETVERLRLKFAPDGNDWPDVINTVDDNFDKIFEVK